MNESKLELMERLRRENRWDEAGNFKEAKRAEFRAEGKSKQEAVDVAWDAMAEAYPPLPITEPKDEATTEGTRIQGLADIPLSWGELPANSTLQAELSWVQANRLAIVRETAIGSIVTLSAARSPAPSWSALGWLETSMRCYSKYIDVVAKSLKDQQDEQDVIKREKKAIQEVRVLLAEMQEDKGRTRPL